MVRTIVSLPEEDKKWLDAQAAREGVPMTELLRCAVKLLRKKAEEERKPFKLLLERTRGTWRKGDGLAWQRRLRNEW